MPLELVSSGVSLPNSAGIELLVGLQEKKHAFETKHIDIVVVSPESKHYLKKMAESPHSEGGLGGVSFPLVSDLNSVAASLYGIPCHHSAESDTSQATMYILAPQMVIRDRETHRASNPPTVEHILNRLTALQQKDSS
jgi:alkyl hydroperoxide reductase subunit AhpC